MTTKEIAQAVNREERTVRNWVKKLTEKSSVIAEKSSASSPMKPADFTLDETCQIIEVGLGKNASEMYRMNAVQNQALSTHNASDYRIDRLEKMMETMIASIPVMVKSIVSSIQLPAPTETSHYSLKAYFHMKGEKLTMQDASRYGKVLVSMARVRDMEIRKVPDEQFGEVNSYPKQLLDDYFSS